MLICLLVLASTPDTAVVLADYSLTTTSVMFDTAGTQTAVFTVNIVDDLDVDTDWTFSLTLDTVTGQGAELGSPTEITITILENGRLGQQWAVLSCK